MQILPNYCQREHRKNKKIRKYVINISPYLHLRGATHSNMSPVVDNLMVIAWGVIGATSVFAALNTYEVSIALLTKKGSE